MATYTELFELRVDSDLLNKISYAIVKKCKDILDNVASTPGQKEWARIGFVNPETKKTEIVWPVLNSQEFQTVSDIKNLSDNDTLYAVGVAIDYLIADLT